VVPQLLQQRGNGSNNPTTTSVQISATKTYIRLHPKSLTSLHDAMLSDKTKFTAK